MPQALPDNKSTIASVAKVFSSDDLRIAAYQALKSFEAEQEQNRNLTYAFHPCIVVSKDAAKKDKLKLAPLVDLNKLKTEPFQNALQIKVENATVYFSGIPKVQSLAKIKDDSLFVPYFWVESTDKVGDANMKLVQAKVGNVTIPVYQSKSNIEPYTPLKYFKPPKAAPEKLVGVKRDSIDELAGSKQKSAKADA